MRFDSNTFAFIDKPRKMCVQTIPPHFIEAYVATLPSEIWTFNCITFRLC